MTDSIDALRSAPLVRVLHALAAGHCSSLDLTEACLAAIGRESALNAWVHVDAEGARAAAVASDARRRDGTTLGRLDGVPLAIKDNFDVAGMPGANGLPPTCARLALEDAHVVSRLRGAGAVLLGKTALDEAAFGTLGANPHTGAVGNPRYPGRASGGSSAGSAAAVAAGHAIAALGSDTMGSVRIPAAFCGLVGHKPTFGELSCRGMAPALRRLDSPGVITRCVQDVLPLLGIMAGYDAGDPRSRRRRVPLAPPDWAPGSLRAGMVADLETLGSSNAVATRFDAAVATAALLFGSTAPLQLALAPLELAASRRAALLLMEAEILAAQDEGIAQASAPLQRLLDYARSKSAADFARADRRLDAHVVQVRALFERFDVILLPTVPQAPPAVGAPEPPNLADFTALASLAGGAALSLPLGEGIGLQLVGPPGSDLRLLELGEVLAAMLDVD